MNTHTLKEAMFYHKMNQKTVRCDLCAFRCEIKEGNKGICNVRENIDGKLFSLVYGKPCAMAIDAIERRPFFHFKPGSSLLTLSTIGCNFKCNFCVNSQISQEKIIEEEFVSPEQVIRTAVSYGAEGICFAYTEPTIFLEYVLDIAKIAKKSGLFCSVITNGFMTPEAFNESHKWLDAILVNFKASGNSEHMLKMASVPDTEPIFDFVTLVAEKRKHLEISDLIMPNHNENSFEKLCEWIGNEINSNTPLHMLQFHPAFKLLNMQPTSLKKMMQMRLCAKKFLEHVYFSNMPRSDFTCTICPQCKNTVIRRIAFTMIENNLVDGCCKFCNKKILKECGV